MKHKPTLQDLRDTINYDHETGIFTWKVDINNKSRRGGVVGNVGSHGYIEMRVCGQRWLAHRLAWYMHYGVMPKKFIDHKDTIRTNNWIENLRESNNGQNMQNRTKQANNTSGMKGVTWHKASGKWMVQIWRFGVKHYGGLFDSLDEAGREYDRLSKQLHGEFSRGNKPAIE